MVNKLLDLEDSKDFLTNTFFVLLLVDSLSLIWMLPKSSLSSTGIKEGTLYMFFVFLVILPKFLSDKHEPKAKRYKVHKYMLFIDFILFLVLCGLITDVGYLTILK